jgi:hypothetical protein
VIAVALLVLVGWGWVTIPRYWINAQTASQHRQWMSYTRPPTHIVFEPSGPKAKELWQSGKGYTMRPGGVFHRTGWGGELSDALFLHGRRRPDGQRRVVWVSLGYLSGTPYRFQLEADGYVPATIARPAQRLPNVYADPLPVDAAGKPPRLYAGQPDPNDESHFTMAYEFESEGRSGVIHGWLRDDDTIDFDVQEGPPKQKQKESK